MGDAISLIHVRDGVEGSDLAADVLYIGRQRAPFMSSPTGRFIPRSKWANPFKEGQDGDLETVLGKYEEFVRNSPALMACLGELDGKRLACWCEQKGACHGDVLVRLRRELGR